MSNKEVGQEHEKLLDELTEIVKSEKLKSSTFHTLKSVYLKINLAYISMCEAHSNLPYMPSSKCDMLFARYAKLGDKESACKIVERRLNDIKRFTQRV